MTICSYKIYGINTHKILIRKIALRPINNISIIKLKTTPFFSSSPPCIGRHTIKDIA